MTQNLFGALLFACFAVAAHGQNCAWDDEQAQECGGNWKKAETCCPGHVCGSWKTCTMIREPTPPTPAELDPIPAPTPRGSGNCPTGDLKISCIKWLTTGGRGQHLHAIIAVEDDNGPVAGADVTMSLTRDGKEFKRTTATTSGASQASLSTYPDLAQCPHGAAGTTSDQCVNKATAALYEATVLDISVEGCNNGYAGDTYQDKWVQFPGPRGKGSGRKGY